MKRLLNQLGTMLKKRQNTDFKAALREQIMHKAEAMNEKKSKRAWSFNFSNFFTQKLAPVTAIGLVALMIIYIINPGGQIVAPTSLVDIASAKDYYTLTPVESDSSGIAPSTSFILASKENIDANEVKNALTTIPETELKLSQKSATEVTVETTTPMAAGEVYSFHLAAQELKDSPFKKEYSWAFQVSEDLAVTGTLPRNEAVRVPINTGIEIRFTHADISADDFKKNFKIEPTVQGSFEVNSKTAVFAPSSLKEATIYTVTLNKDLPLTGSDKSLQKEYKFQFETNYKTRKETSLNFHQVIHEYRSDSAPALPLSLYYNQGENEVAAKVYRYPDADAYLSALQTRTDLVPSWCYFTQKVYRAPTTDLELVVDIPATTLAEGDYMTYLVLPEALSEGYYLINASKNDSSAQTFLQITNTATYINLNSTKPFVWVNDLTTKKPIAGAEVEIIDHNTKAKTNAQGIAEFSDLPKTDNAYIKVTANGKSSFYFARLSVESGEPFFGWYANKDNWTFLKTDRGVYHPTDTISYWALIQGRDKTLNGTATAQIIESNWFEGGERRKILYSEEISLKDGKAFEGKFDIENLIPGYDRYYELEILQGETTLTSTSITIEDFVKPAYEITIDPEKTAIFEGESTNINVRAKFFEGTAVPNLPLNYSAGSARQSITTNSKGIATVQFTAPISEYCGRYGCELFTEERFSAYPKREELADIRGATNVTVARSTVGIDDITINRDEMSFTTRKVDINKVAERDYSSYRSEVYGAIAPNTEVGIVIERIDTTKIETGQYYDYVDKVVRKKYKYETTYAIITKTSLNSDANGKFNYQPGLDQKERYRATITIFDENRKYFEIIKYLGPEYINRYNNFRLDGIEDGTKFNVNDKISLTLKDSNDKIAPSDGSNHYLFFHAQRKFENYEVKTNPNYELTFTKDLIPNITIEAVIFDGRRFIDVRPAYAKFDKETRRLKIDIKSNKAKYEPGEKVKIDVQVNDKESGKPAEAAVNIYLVDEAYYSLYSDSDRDPLEFLFRSVPVDSGYTYSSHREARILGGMGGCFIKGTQILMADGSTKNIEDIISGDQILTRISPFDPRLVPGKVARTQQQSVGEYLLVNNFLGVTAEHVMFINGQWKIAGELQLGDTLINDKGEKITVKSIEKLEKNVNVFNFEVANYHTYFANGVYVHNDKGGARSDFRDTALFELVETGSNGKASIEFTLPDNITTWRVTAAAIQSGGRRSIKAGFGSTKIPVTKDIFALPVINSEYLAEDKPEIPVRAYGDALEKDDSVKFSMESETLNYKENKEGLAFDPTYFELPALTTGQHKITSTVESAGHKDTIILPTTVKNSHLTESKSWTGTLSENGELQGSSEFRTDVIFSNNEVGPLFGTLYSAAYDQGDRADQAAARHLARKWLNENFEENFSVADFENFLYQKSGDDDDHGISLLLYDDSRLKLSALLAALDPSLFNTSLLQEYFEKTLNNKTTLPEKILALYGLASINENVLTELNFFVENHDLSSEDKIYAALTYLKFGDRTKATKLFLEIKKSNLDPSAMALAALIANEIGAQQRDDLWKSALENQYKIKDLIVTEKMLFVKSRLEMGVRSEVNFSVNGKKVTLKNMEIHRMSLLPAEVKKIKFSNINGDVSVHTSYREPANINSFKTDSRINIERTYRVNGQTVTQLHAGDLVEVRFTINVPIDLEGSYQIREYLPSGLQTTTQRKIGSGWNNKHYYPYKVDKQELSFHIYCGETDKQRNTCANREFYYLARVINQGEFVTEPAIIQNYKNEALLNLSSTQKGTVTIGKPRKIETPEVYKPTPPKIYELESDAMETPFKKIELIKVE